MITDHAFIPGKGNYCVHTKFRHVAHGVSLRDPCLHPREDHADHGERDV